MRHHAGRVLRTIATLTTLLADRVDPQPTAWQPGSFTVHSSTGTETFEPRLTWHSKT